MKLEDVPLGLIRQFERGHTPADEPLGLQEAAYAAWKDSGGQVLQAAEDFGSWAIVELMGHVRLAGRISEVEKFGTKLGRIDVPVDGGPAITQYFSGSSVYRITPVTEAVARQVALRNKPEPVSPWDFPKQLAAHGLFNGVDGEDDQ